MKKNNLSKNERMKTQNDINVNRKIGLNFFRQNGPAGFEKKSFKNDLLRKMLEEKEKKAKESEATTEAQVVETP